MGKINQGILGGVSGSVANLTGGSWKGINYLRSKPTSVANPRTNLQIAQRTKMQNIVAFAKQVLGTIIKPLNDRFAQKESGYNLFVKRNIRLFSSSRPSPPQDLIISEGKLGKTEIGSFNLNSSTQQIELAWDPSPIGSYQQSTDILHMCVCDDYGNIIATNNSGIPRQDGGAVILSNIGTILAGEEYFCYIAFRRIDGTMVGDTGHSSTIAT